MSPREDAWSEPAAADGLFDREWQLEELLPQKGWPALLEPLRSLAGERVRLVAGARAEAGADEHAEALRVDIEPLGWLLGPAARAQELRAAAALLRQILLARQRYLMASALHVESVRADYVALLEKHHALEQSERRYRELAAELETRVAEQVALIETRQRQLYQSERLASIGQLAAGMAHEINNPIGFMRSNLSAAAAYVSQLQAALQAWERGDKGAWERADARFVLEDFTELLQDCVSGADRIAALVRDLKGFSSVDRDEVAVIDLAQSLDELCRLLTPRLPPGATLAWDGQACASLRCQPGPLQQALFNVLDNALKAIGPGGQIRIHCHRDAELQHIEVCDDGCGIAPEHLPHVFDPFFTTRGVGAGMGLGLTLARDALLAQQGSIELDSQPGVGTRVILRLALESRT